MDDPTCAHALREGLEFMLQGHSYTVVSPLDLNHCKLERDDGALFFAKYRRNAELVSLLFNERRELCLLAENPHPHLLSQGSLGVVQLPDEHTGGITVLVTPWVDALTLDEIIRAQTALSLKQKLDIFYGVAEALDYFHEQGKVHCDVKPGNVLVVDSRRDSIYYQLFPYLFPARYHPVLFDLEFVFDLDVGICHPYGTPLYKAPEVSSELAYSFRSDIFSLGVLLYELLAEFTPFRIPRPHSSLAPSSGQISSLSCEFLPSSGPSVLSSSAVDSASYSSSTKASSCSSSSSSPFGDADPLVVSSKTFSQIIAERVATYIPQPLYRFLPEVSRRLSACVSTAMEKDPDKRFSTVPDFVAAVRNATHRPTPGQRVSNYFFKELL